MITENYGNLNNLKSKNYILVLKQLEFLFRHKLSLLFARVACKKLTENIIKDVINHSPGVLVFTVKSQHIVNRQN